MNFKSLFKLSIILTTLSLLSACAVISKKECLADDWTNIGYEVGIKGEINELEAFKKRQNICARHGTFADQQRFTSGYKIGIEQYCHVDNSVLLGIKGDYKAVDTAICRQANSAEFKKGFYAGSKLHYLNQALSETESIIHRIDSDISSYQLDRKIVFKKLHAKDIDSSTKSSLRKRLKIINYEINQLKDEIYYNEKIAYRQLEDARQYEHFLKNAYPRSFRYTYQAPNE